MIETGLTIVLCAQVAKIIAIKKNDSVIKARKIHVVPFKRSELNEPTQMG